MRILVILCTLILAACSSSAPPVKEPSPSVEVQVSEQTPLYIENFDEWYAKLLTMPYSKQNREAMAVYNDSQTSQLMKEKALYIMATRPGVTNRFALQTLSNTYSSADVAKRMQMESDFLAIAKQMPISALQKMAQAVQSSQENMFPWIILAWEAAQANLLLDNTGTIQRLGYPEYYANPLLFGLTGNAIDMYGENMERLIINPNPEFHSVCVTMALPTTGSYAQISNQILRGARAAQNELADTGVHILLNVYDTEDPLWVQKIGQLSPQCIIVGGPLRSLSLDKALEANLLDSKAFFSFMPQLPLRPLVDEAALAIKELEELAENSDNNQVNTENQDSANNIDTQNSELNEEIEAVEEIEIINAFREGDNIWRFFTAPQDQINVVLDFATNELNVSEFASFYPNDSYGNRMSELFVEIANEEDVFVNQVGYLANSTRSWSGYAGDFLGSTTPEGGGLPELRSKTQAFFLPDTWSNMEVLAPILHYQGAVYLPFFGTSLWENGLNNVSNLSLEYYDLTIFPGSWNKDSYSYGSIQLKNTMEKQGNNVDDWAVIGYDFVQMVSALNYDTLELDSALLNEKLFYLQKLAWAGAPFIWEEEGVVSRKLRLFQPDIDGMKILDKDEFFASYQARLENVKSLQDFYEREKTRRLEESLEEFFEEEEERMLIFQEEQSILQFEAEKQRLLELEDQQRINN